MVEHDSIKSLINDLRYSPQQVAEVLQATLDSEVIDDKQRNFIRLLADNRRLVLIPEIAKLFEQYMIEDEQVVRAEVISALPLEDSDQQAISSALSKRTGRRAEISCKVDPSLLAGATVRLDDFVIDG